jgi:murein tripeptide amidase MpaA
MSVAAIDAAINHITTTYPAISQAIGLPEPSVEGRPIRAIKIAHGGGSNRTGVLFLGGTHARELVNPETVLSFGLRLCDAYTNNTGLTFGPKSYAAGTVQMVVNGLDIFLLPLVNPDGRAFCFTPGNAMWRKNRAANAGLPCRGVDLNRNYDFLWSSGIGTSTNSCSDVFKGPGAFSEPETRNVRWMIDNYPNLACLVDVHSYSELVLYPWGDDNNQTTDPTQNFQNPAYDGARGVPGSGYQEYIPEADLDAHVAAAERMRDGIAAVRGRVYTVQQSIALYPTSGTTHDYAYSRKFIDTGRRRILGFTLETAREFQPNDVEKDNVITEVSAGLMECLLETLCPAEVIEALLDALFPLSAMRAVRDRDMLKTASGKRYERMFRAHSLELIAIVTTNEDALRAGASLLKVARRFVGDGAKPSKRKIGKQDVKEVAAVLAVFRKRAGKALKASIDRASADMRGLEGKTLSGVFAALDKKRPPKEGPAAKNRPTAATRPRKPKRKSGR